MAMAPNLTPGSFNHKYATIGKYQYRKCKQSFYFFLHSSIA